MDSVTRFPLDLNQKIVSVAYFTDSSSFGRAKENTSSVGYRLNYISKCYYIQESGRYIYLLNLIGDRDTDERLLFSQHRMKKFEAQFPFFPYYRDVYMSELLDKKFEIIEQQNIALLSHLETIMIALKLRAADDDNLRLISKQ